MKKKLLSLCLIISMSFALASCGNTVKNDVGVGVIVGPTAMGLVDLKTKPGYTFQCYQTPTEVTQKLVNGEIQVACLPSNLGATLYAKTDGNIQILTTVVNGVLYIVENGESVQSLQDLKGKTIIGSGKGGTPEYALSTLLKSAGLKLGTDVSIKWLDNHADVAQKVASTKGAIGLLPEPQVSLITSKAKTVKVALDLNELWMEVTGQELPMGILVAKKDFIENNRREIKKLLKYVEESVEKVNGLDEILIQDMIGQGVVPDADLARKVIPNCSLTCMSPEDNKATISAFYEKLFEADPSSLGGAMPGDDIYYGIR